MQQSRGIRVDHRKAEQTTLGDVLRSRVEALQSNRRVVKGKDAEVYRLNRILRDDAKLCVYALSNLTYVKFED